MSYCVKCGTRIPDGETVCAKCSAPNTAPNQPNNNNRKKLLIILFSLIGVLVVLGGITVFLLLNRSKSEVNTFDFTCSQYTAEMNRILGDNKLDESKWVVNEASAVYAGDGYRIALKTDKDSEKVTEIRVGPTGKEYAAKMAAASLMAAEPDIDQKTALTELAELAEKKQYKIVREETVVKIDEEEEQYVITPRPKDKPAEKSTPDKITTAPHEYTALELMDKSLAEITEIMGDDYTINNDNDYSFAFGSGGGTYYIVNENTLPGIAVHPSFNSGFYDDMNNDIDVREQIKKGSYDYNGIAVYGSRKLNENISADMTYNELAAQIGDFEMHGAGQQTLFFTTNIKSYDVTFVITTYDNEELGARLKDGKVSSADLKEINPTLHDIAVRREEQETTTEEPTEEPTKAPSYSDYSSYLGSWSYTYTPDEIPEEVLKDDYSYRYYMQHRPTTSVVFSEIDGNIAKFELCKGNISAISDAIITAEIVDGVIDFEYIDSWGSNGHGTITLNGDSIHVYCVEDHHADGGRAQLNCDETLTRK